MERRAEAARLWREEQIAMLESLPTLTQKQADQLKALRLEHEFQQRAEREAQRRAGEEGEEEEEEDDEDVAGEGEGLVLGDGILNQLSSSPLEALRTHDFFEK
jgi:hypothetical protein